MLGHCFDRRKPVAALGDDLDVLFLAQIFTQDLPRQFFVIHNHGADFDPALRIAVAGSRARSSPCRSTIKSRADGYRRSRSFSRHLRTMRSSPSGSS